MGTPQRQAAGPGVVWVGGHTAAAGCGAPFVTFLHLGGRKANHKKYILPDPTAKRMDVKTTSKTLKSPANQEKINGAHCAQNTGIQASHQIGFLKNYAIIMVREIDPPPNTCSEGYGGPLRPQVSHQPAGRLKSHAGYASRQRGSCHLSSSLLVTLVHPPPLVLVSCTVP